MDKFEESKQIFALADCNAFFCSCEQLFRPDLKGRPVGVLSNNDGCFVSRTKELKKLGVPMGAPFFKYKDLCHFHQVTVFSSNFALYSDISKRVIETLKNFSDQTEVYSVDEAFLNLSTLWRKDLHSYGKKIKATVAKEIGIPLSIGIAPTRTLAKVANHWAKNNERMNGVCSLLKQNEIDFVLAKTPVNDIWGIGKKNGDKLKALGIKTALQFKNYSNEKLILKLLTKLGQQTQNELRGIPCINLNESHKKKQSILCSRTFPKATGNPDEVRKALANYITYATAKMRQQSSLTAHFDIFYRTDPHRSKDLQIKKVLPLQLSSVSLYTPDFITKAWNALDKEKFNEQVYRYRKAGVILYKFEQIGETQLNLFSPTQPSSKEKQKEELMTVLDQVNQRFGKHTLKSMACGTDSKELWKMKRNLKSPAYTTSWNELRSLY